ncbi:MAG: folate-binding protein [endosymbiont of Galathealinum brachiosum]|uniref:Folate-binding protein n=1 Tax=endosymbiont of Galathealinum brachiosum TaxID=2200906 RepID=A0A370DGA0_9GAMM|nr:MAG: folate-binding protein [endosymbiont of Galathealinum brachiosum]
MKPAWLDFLKDAGAEIENNKVVSFGNLEREHRMVHTGLVICDLSHHGLISIDGEDTADFLQGQLTNDVRDVSLQHSQLSAYCTHKGRMLANFRVFKRDDSYFLSLPQSLLESILKRISMFILMAKVTIKDNNDALIKIGLSGPKADEQLSNIISDLPTETDDVTQSNGYTIIKCAGTLPRYEIMGELEAIKKIWGQLDVNAAPAGADAWETLDIMAGIPTITPETSEAFVPQMTNMHVINGVNFQKGCYTGQEVVARMQYLGKLKRRMFRINIESDNAVIAGDKLFAKDSTSGQGTGQIVNSQVDPDGGHIALAVIDIADAEAGSLQLHDENGPAITVHSLPYSVE